MGHRTAHNRRTLQQARTLQNPFFILFLFTICFFCAFTTGTPFWERKLATDPVDYAVLLWGTTRIRGMAVANPRVPLMPWIAPKRSLT